MDDHRLIERKQDVDLRKPILVAAFRGWNDAGDAASFAAKHLQRVWDAQHVSSIDPEEFYDFQVVRPQVELVEGRTRRIEWPSNDFHAAQLSRAQHDVLLLIGTEPNARWRTFTRTIVEEAKHHDVGFVITLGALLADVPHSRPAQITGTAADDDLIEKLNLQRSKYEGPTGILGVLHDAFSRAGIPSASLWAAVPHYLAVSPNPKAALALIEKTVQLTGIPVDIGDLEHATRNYEERVADVIAADEDVQAYVHLLEERIDEVIHEDQIDPSQIPSADALAADIERYLREQEQ